MNNKWKKSKVKNKEAKTAAEKYHVPDRTYSDYFCKVCESHMNSSQMWDSHIQGKRHQKKVKDALEKPPEKPTVTSPAIPLIESRLMDISDPIVGLKYICEIRKADLLLGPTYKCFLCSGCFATGDILIEHLGSAKHILAYWKVVEPNTLKPFENFSKGSLENIAYDRAVGFEQKYGRGIMEVQFEKQPSVLPPEFKERYSDQNSSPPKEPRAEFSGNGSSVDPQSKTYRDRSPFYEHRPLRNRSLSRSPSPLPRSDFRNHYSTNAEREFRHLESLERERIESADALRRSASQLDDFLNRERYESTDRSIPRDTQPTRYESTDRSIPMDTQPTRYESTDRSISRDTQPTRDWYDSGDASYRRILPRDEQQARDINSNISRSELTQQHGLQDSWTSQNRLQTAAPTFQDKSPTLKDFIEAIKICPATYTISLLEQMGPFEITNDDECQRLYEIAKHIDNNVAKFLLSSLNDEQQKQLIRVIQGQSSSSSSSNAIIPGINDDSSIMERRNNSSTTRVSPDRWHNSSQGYSF